MQNYLAQKRIKIIWFHAEIASKCCYMVNIFFICFNYWSVSKRCNDSHTSTQQQLTVLLQRHSVLTGVSTAWLQMAQPNSPNKICTEYTSVLPAGKSSSASGLNVSSPLLAAQQWGNTKGYHFSLATSLAPPGSHSAGELILFICCGYLQDNLKAGRVPMSKRTNTVFDEESQSKSTGSQRKEYLSPPERR